MKFTCGKGRTSKMMLQKANYAVKGASIEYKEVVYKRIINCTNAAELRKIVKYLHKIICK
jgi:hypothetical protein